jgi:putative endonuclease
MSASGHSSLVRRIRRFYVYLVASRSRTIYVGMTSDLVRRVWEHRTGACRGFTARYRIHRLVYFEEYADARLATTREREIKGWSRARKLRLIEGKNAGWIDLAAEWFE